MKVKIINLEKKEDERGWLAELLHSGDLEHKNFGQLLVTVAKPGITKGGHYHTRKEEWFVVVSGKGELFLRDNESREEQTIPVGEQNMVAVQIPLNTAHWITNIGNKDLFLLAYCNEEFDPNDTDTFSVSK